MVENVSLKLEISFKFS